MPDLAYLTRSVYGAWRLARLDPAGMTLFELSIPGFWRSFFAAVVVAPFYVALVVLRFEHETDLGADLELSPFLGVKLVAYAISWVAFPLAMLAIARLLSLGAFYVPFIIAYNWSAVIQIAVFLPVSLIEASGLLPEALGAALMMIATIAILFYQWFIARVALQTTALTAAGLVAFDLLLGILIDVGAMRRPTLAIRAR
jgi:hypothetical protein